MKKGIFYILACMLIIATLLTPLVISTTTNTPLRNGNILYVGGSGPGNYSTIQAAIDAALAKDTVFVYDDSSPYYEHLIINKSIQLCGSNWKNTIINGEDNRIVILVTRINVTISNFTITGDGPSNHLIQVQNCTNVSITHNFFTSKDKQYGITVFISGISPLDTGILIQNNSINNTIIGIQLAHSYSHIQNNLIQNTIEGIRVYDDSYNIITKNTLKNCSTGILLLDVNENKIYYNNFLTCKIAMELEGNENIIQWNEFSGCLHYGIFEYTGRQNEIHFNNFMNNNISAFFHWVFPSICINHWNENYWDDHHTFFPKIISGILQFRDSDVSPWYISWMNFDWHPAQDPYDIS